MAIASRIFHVSFLVVLMLSLETSICSGKFDRGATDMVLFSIVTSEGGGRGDPAGGAKPTMDDILIEAIRTGDSGQAEALLSRGANPNAIHKSGGCALRWAAYYGQRDLVILLLNRGAVIKMQNGGHAEQELIRNAILGQANRIKDIAARGVDINARDSGGETALHWASAMGNEKVVGQLITLGAEINILNKAGCTPLTLASLNGHEHVVQLLLRSGADPDIKGSWGGPETFANIRGHEKVIKILKDFRKSGIKPKPSSTISKDTKTTVVEPETDTLIQGLKWEFVAVGEYIWGPTIANGVAYIMTAVDENDQSGSLLFAVDTATGIEKWKHKLDCRIGGIPKVADGVVYFGGRESPDSRNCIYALETNSGRILWKYETGGQVVFISEIRNGIIYFGSFDGTIHAVDTRTGKAIWRHVCEKKDPNESMYVYLLVDVVGGTIYFGSGEPQTQEPGFLAALDMNNGAEKWKLQMWGQALDPTIYEGTVFVGNRDGCVYAVESETGKEKWRFNSKKSQVNVQYVSVYEVIDGVAYVSSVNGDTGSSKRDTRIFALDSASGQAKWEVATKAASLNSLSIIDGKLYAVGSDGYVYVVDTKTGSIDFRIRYGGGYATIKNGVIYWGTRKGKLYAMELDKAEKIDVHFSRIGDVHPGDTKLNKTSNSQNPDSHDTPASRQETATTPPKLAQNSVLESDTSAQARSLSKNISEKDPEDPAGMASFRGNLRRTGVYATEGMQNPAGLKWKAQVGRVWDPIVLYNGLILFFRENDYLLTAIDISNGREKWKVPNSCRGNLAVAEGLAYYRSGQPLYCVDIKNQEIKWRQDKWTNEDIVVSDGILVTRTANDDLCAFDARTGRELWDFVIGQRQFHLRVYNGLVYTHSHDGAIQGVDMKSGREKSRLKLEKPEYLTGLFEISRGVMFCKVFFDEPPYGDDQGEVKSGKYFLLAFDLETGKRKWKIPCEGFFFEPALSDDTIIIESGDRLWAFDINTGQQQWSVKVPGVNYQPTIFEGAVYIACDDGCFYAHDLRNGAEKWSFEVGKRIHRDRTPFLVGEKGVVYFITPFEGIYSLDTHAAERGYTEHNLFETAGAIVSTPAIIDGTAFFGSVDGHVYAVNVLSKKEIWRFKTTGSVVSSPLIANQTLYCGSDDQHLYSLDTKTGQEKWRFKTTGAVVSSPTISGGMLFFGSRDKHLYALDPKDGTLKWRFKTSGQVDSSPAVADGIVCFGSHDGYMYAVDFRTGRKKWRFKASAAITSSPAIMDKRVFFGDLAGNFYAVELKTGKKVWNFAANSPIPSSAAVKDNMVYFGAEDGTFFVLDATNGQQKDSQKFRGAINSSPSIVGDDGAIYFGCDDGSVYGLDRQLNKKLEIKTGGPVRSSPAIANGAVYFGSADGSLHIIR